MVKVKATRVDKNVPEFVRKEWKTGDKTGMADLLIRENFNQEWFTSPLGKQLVFAIKETIQIPWSKNYPGSFRQQAPSDCPQASID